MRLLIDTHVWIWAEEAPDNFGKKCKSLLSDTSNQLFVSTVSSLELAQLLFKGRINLALSLDRWIEKSVDNLLLKSLQIDHKVATGAYQLPEDFHLDPADRILAATAIEHQLTLVTADERLLKAGWLTRIDARK